MNDPRPAGSPPPAGTGPGEDGAHRAAIAEKLGFTLALAVVLAAASWQSHQRLNPDAIAYLRLARYWVRGEWSLAVSGYWGPLWSWAAAPLVATGIDPLVAARLVMAGTALVFVAGTSALLAAMGLGATSRRLGVTLAGVAGAAWAVRDITPDLLLAGLLNLGFARLVAAAPPPSTAPDSSPGLPDSPQPLPMRRALSTGLIFGLAFLAKAVALPVAVIELAAVTLLMWLARLATAGSLARRAALVCAGMALLVLPWTAVLTLKYGRPIVSNSAVIAHAVMAPAAPRPPHPFERTLHQPPPGRLIAWEDPAPSDYPLWSPWQDREHFRHQVRLLGRNLAQALADLLSLDRLGIGLLAAAAGLAVQRPWPANLGRQRWRWSLVPIAAVTAVYLPVFAEGQRYYFPTFAPMAAAACGMVEQFAAALGPRVARLRTVGFGLVAVSLGGATSAELLRDLEGNPVPDFVAAEQLADQLRAAGVVGSLAGGGKVGLYTAFLLERPWHGTARGASLDDYRGAQAEVWLVDGSERALLAELAADAGIAVIELPGRPAGLRVFRRRESADRRPAPE